MDREEVIIDLVRNLASVVNTLLNRIEDLEKKLSKNTEELIKLQEAIYDR